MKKNVMLGIILFLMILPLASFAKTAISDADLDAVTAEAGVSIDFINLTASNTAITSISWGDSNGFTGYTGAGYLGFENVAITGNLTVMSGTMTMDVGTNGSGVTKVFITLPTLTLGTANIAADIVLAQSADLQTGKQVGGRLTINGFTTTTNGSIAVYAHN